MHNLAIETYVNQYFWFLLILVLFHTFMTNEVITRISSLLKARKVREGSSIWLGEGSEDLFSIWLGEGSEDLFAQVAIEYSKLKIKN